jgi:hypothetical protein
LSDGAARLAARYPRVWHVIEADGAGAWLMETGLLPAADLYRLAGLEADGANRAAFQRVELSPGRIAMLRPQLMADQPLTATLAGSFAGRPAAWRRHIDAHVFFWPEPRRRDGFVRACARLRARGSVGAAPPRVLAIDTAALLRRHGASAFFARINTGAVLRGGVRVRRDDTTFVSVADYQSGPVAELAIKAPVMLRGILITCWVRRRGSFRYHTSALPLLGTPARRHFTS